MPSNNNKHGLGRGLNALFGDESFNLDEVLNADDKGIKTVSIEKLRPCAFQPRKSFDEEAIKSLAQSIKEKGVLQPILVRPKNGLYEIVAGERRYRAAKMAGLIELPVIEKELKDNEVLEVALVENLVRKDLLPLEEAHGLNCLINQFNYTQERLSEIVGKSRSNITNILRLLTLPASVQKYLDEGKLTSGHARALVGLENAAELAEQIIGQGLSVRQVEEIISKIKKQGNNPKPKKPAIVKDKELCQIERDLSQKIGVRVIIKAGQNGRGRVVLEYKQLAELENIIDKLEK